MVNDGDEWWLMMISPHSPGKFSTRSTRWTLKIPMAQLLHGEKPALPAASGWNHGKAHWNPGRQTSAADVVPESWHFSPKNGQWWEYYEDIPVNWQLDPENHPFFGGFTNLPTPGWVEVLIYWRVANDDYGNTGDFNNDSDEKPLDGSNRLDRMMSRVYRRDQGWPKNAHVES